MESTLPSAPVTSLQSALDESVSLASLPMLASESLVHPSAVSASAPAPILSLGPAQEASNDTRTPPQASSFLQNVSHGTDLDDTSSFSTLSSPSSFSPSPPYNPTVAHISSAKDLSLSPLKRRRLESHLAGSPTYSSNSSSSSVLSSPSPPRIFHASLEVDLMRPSPVHYDDDMYRKQESDQRVASSEKHRPSMETELFGTASTKLPKKSTAEEKRLTSPLSKKPSTGSDSEEYANLGSKKLEEQTTANSSTIPKGSNGQSRGVAKRPLTRKDSIGPKKELSREVVVIKIGNDVKPLVTVKLVPYTKSKSSNSIKSEVAAKAQKVSAEADSKSNLAVGVNGGSAKSTLTTLTGTGVRRSSILHSDQIVASALSRYKNHFHMLVEDSDSTVASNPSSTGGDMMHVSLQYPEKDSKEKFTLMKPFLSRSKTESDDKDEYNPIEDLVSTVKTIIDHFFSPEKQKALFGTANEGLYRNLTKFKNRKDGAQFLKAVEDFNQIMQDHKSSGMIQQHVQEYGHRLPYDLVVHILGQVYSRTVAARASRLNQYEAFSNNVYGEILPILTKEFIQKTKVNENKVFVDLGCGIGNVVLQVALQTGAESYGVEIMDTPAKFAKKQAKEFEARSRAYGLHHGKVTMIHGDFLETPELAKILARADVVLVNNYAFNSALNQSLLQLFLDLKEGCKIISLKTFVSLDHKINVRNAGSVESILRVRKYPYYTNAVSWTHNGGEYFIATVDRTAVQAFWERAMANGGAGLDDGGRRSSRRR
ncbi:Nucleosomal histone H3-Lys79 methylase [Podila humilis]|nr:Nucleosomal histone H3-Lys79 methylase [Podila humilis]